MPPLRAASARPTRRRRSRGWRAGERGRLERTGGDDVGSILLLGAPTYVASTLLDRAERRGMPRWILAVAYAAIGVLALVARYLPGAAPTQEVRPSELGWMGYGVAGAVAFVGLWVGSIPFRGSGVGTVLRRCAIGVGLLPIVAHLAGLI